MNTELINKIADAIERNPEGFDMSVFDGDGHCGTVGCIAGYVLQHFGYRGTGSPVAFVEKNFGIPKEDANTLCLPKSDTAHYDAALNHPAFITAERAVKTLRHLAETGEVNWDA